MNWRSLRASGTKPARTRRAFRPFGEPLEERAVPAVLPTGFTEAAVASGLTNPTAMEFSPEGRLFVAEQAGTLEVYQDGTRLQADFFRDTPLSVNASGERGLLGLAFDPDYATNHFVYVYYTATSPTIHNRLSRFTANAAGDLALAGSELVLLDLDPLTATNHNGGAIHFGPDGKLYVAVGENAVGAQCPVAGQPAREDPPDQRRRHDPDRQSVLRPGDGGQPRDLGARAPQSLHLRLPARDRADVHQRRGAEHLGGDQRRRPRRELRLAGDRGGHQQPELRDAALLLRPQPGAGDRRGAFYNPATVQFPSDYGGITSSPTSSSGWIRRIDPETGTVEDFATDAGNPVDLRVGADGSLYYLARGTGQVFRVQFTASPGGSQGQGPSIVQQPESRTVPAGSSVTFGVLASGSAPLSYRWQRDGANIAGATGASYTISARAADSGALFRVVVSNAFGSVTSAAATLTVTGGRPATPPSDPRAEPGRADRRAEPPGPGPPADPAPARPREPRVSDASPAGRPSCSASSRPGVGVPSAACPCPGPPALPASVEADAGSG